MKVVIIGCDRLGAELALRLSKHGNEVAIVEKDRSRFLFLSKNFKGRTHEGDAFNEEVLLRAGIKEADAFLAITESDSKNYVLGFVAKNFFHIPQVIVRNYDPQCQVICELMGLQAVSSARWGAEQIEEMISHVGLNSVLTVGGGEVEVYAIPVPKEWHGKKLLEMITRKTDQVVISVSRAGKTFIPAKDLVFQESDVIHVAANHEGIEDLRMKTKPVEDGGEA